MNTTRRCALLYASAALGGLAAGTGRGLAQVGPQSDILGQMPLDSHGWTSAPAIRDSIGWEVLGATRERERTVQGQLWIVPEFTDRVRRLNGQRVRVNGYMLPLDSTPRQNQFLLMAYPTSCPFHLTVGSQFFIEVLSPRGVEFSYDALLIEGEFVLVDQDPNAIFYRMRDARLVA